MGDPDKAKGEYPPPWIRQRLIVEAILYGGLLVVLAIWLLVRFLMN